MANKNNRLEEFQEVSHELQEALSMAEHFEKNKKDDGYIIKEGWDIYDIIHSLIVISHAYRGRIMSGKLKSLWQIRDEILSGNNSELLEVAIPTKNQNDA